MNFLAVFLCLSLYLMISAPLAVGSPCREIIGDANSLAAFLTEPIRSNDPFFRLPPVRVDFHNFPRHRTVSVTGFRYTGQESNGYYLLRKWDSSWRSGIGPTFFASESDPTWIISALGPKLARYLGFVLVSDSVMRVPNAGLFNERILALNGLLKQKGFEPIPINWVSGIEIPPTSNPDEVMTYAEQYVRMFHFRRSSPFEDPQLTHDVAHHALEILLTESQLRPFSARLKAAIAFSDFLRIYLPGNSGDVYPLLIHPQNREAVIALLFQLIARDKDNLSGLIPVELMSEESQAERPLNTSFFRVGDFHLGPEMGRPFRRPLSIKSNCDYRVSDWIISTLFIHLVPFLRHHGKIPPERDEGDRKGMELLLKYTQKQFGPSIQIFRNDVSALEEELQRLFVAFDIATGDEFVSTVLARYDGNFEVIGGIASLEHPVVSFRRRIKEMQSVLSED